MSSIRLPLAYAGSIGYYQKYFHADRATFELQEHYIKQTLRNRIYILGPNGVQHLVLPVIKINGSKTAMKDLQISYQTDWVRQHWGALKAAYAASPFFDHYAYDLEPIFHSGETSYLKFSQQIHRFMLQCIGIEVKEQFSEKYDLEDGEIDFRLHDELPEENVDYHYHQVFEINRKFEGNLSLLDAIFNLGPMARPLITNPSKAIFV